MANVAYGPDVISGLLSVHAYVSVVVVLLSPAESSHLILTSDVLPANS